MLIVAKVRNKKLNDDISLVERYYLAKEQAKLFLSTGSFKNTN